MNKKLFGTDGIRGEANKYPMTSDFILKLGQAIGIYFKQHYSKPMVLIGKDTRKSCYMLEQALGAGICSVGVDVYLLGILPTPGIAYLTRGLRACAGIVISASHNPYTDNGIKIFSANGYKLPDEVEDELEALTQKNLDEYLAFGIAIGRGISIDDAIGQYAVFLKEQFPKNLTLEGLRLVIDCANGAAYKVAPKVFQELGAEVFMIGDTPNGKNINDGYGALHPERLQEQVILYKANAGFAFDGDADRVIVIDEKGDIVDGDEIMAICGIDMIQKNTLKHNTIVATIMSNMGLDIALEKYGGKVIRTRVGDRYVVEEMVKGNYNLGGEQSGHLIFRDCSTTGDGILASLNLLKIVVEKQIPISELKKCLEHLPQILKNISVKEKVPIEKLTKLQSIIKQIETKLGNKGRVLFRYSGTENLARIMLEGEDPLLEEYLETIAEHAKNEIEQYVKNSKN